MIDAIDLAYLRVVSGRDALSAQRQRVIEKRTEFDFGVAQHVWIRRAARLVFAQEFAEHTFFVIKGKIDSFDFDADFVRDGYRVDQILARAAVFLIIVVFPVLHEYADHFMTLLLEQQRRDRRIDAARHADDYPLLVSHWVRRFARSARATTSKLAS